MLRRNSRSQVYCSLAELRYLEILRQAIQYHGSLKKKVMQFQSVRIEGILTYCADSVEIIYYRRCSDSIDMTLNENVNKIELFGDSKDIKRFFAEIKTKYSNISRLSGSYTQDPATGESGLEMSFQCKTEDGNIDVTYREEAPACASIAEAEEVRLFKKMTIRVPQAVFDDGRHQDMVDMAKKWMGDVGVGIQLIVTNKMDPR
jgi:hypothetical protein